MDILIFLILCLCLVAFIGGWGVKISIDQYKKAKKREAQAKERRQSYEQKRALWDSNMEESEKLFEPDFSEIKKAVSERNERFKGGAKK